MLFVMCMVVVLKLVGSVMWLFLVLLCIGMIVKCLCSVVW